MASLSRFRASGIWLAPITWLATELATWLLAATAAATYGLCMFMWAEWWAAAAERWSPYIETGGMSMLDGQPLELSYYRGKKFGVTEGSMDKFCHWAKASLHSRVMNCDRNWPTALGHRYKDSRLTSLRISPNRITTQYFILNQILI